MKKIKILALNKDSSGSKFHRVVSPLSVLADKYDNYEIHLFDEKYINEDIAKNYDIIYIHWTQLTRCEMLSLWQQKYNFKIIQDIDDYWVLPLNHPTKTNMDKMIWQLENQMILADYILVSTEELKEKVSKYNKNIFLKKNFLPTEFNSGENQFKITSRDFYRNQKLNIGICGSISHVNDWLSVSSQIYKMKTDKFLKDNCNFIISGYNDNNEQTKKIWDKIVNMFKSEGFNITIHKSKLPKEYMSLYNDIDILLCPLEPIEFNKYKSNLKILECGLKGTIPIGNNKMYKSKIPSDCYIETNNYYKAILELVKLWKKDPYMFNNMSMNLSMNTLTYNNNLQNEETNKLHELFQSIILS